MSCNSFAVTPLKFRKSGYPEKPKKVWGFTTDGKNPFFPSTGSSSGSSSSTELSCQTPKEKPKKLPEELIKEIPRDLSKQAAKEQHVEVTHRPLQDEHKNQLKEIPKNPARELPKEISKEEPGGLKELPRELLKAVHREHPKEVPKEKSEEVFKETPRECYKEALKELLREILEEFSEEVSREERPLAVTQELPKEDVEQPKDVPKEELPKEVPKKEPTELLKDALIQLPKEAPKEIPKNLPPELSREVPNELTKDIFIKLPREEPPKELYVSLEYEDVKSNSTDDFQSPNSQRSDKTIVDERVLQAIISDINSRIKSKSPNTKHPRRGHISEISLVFGDACLLGYYEKVEKLLINDDVNVNDALNHSWSGLMLACYTGRVNVAKFLLGVGADPNFRRETDNFTTIMACACSPFYEETGVLECTKLILEAGAKVNDAVTNGYTPLMFSVKRNHMQIAQLLISHGADINSRDKDGRTALTWATIKDFVEMRKLLLANGAHE